VSGFGAETGLNPNGPFRVRNSSAEGNLPKPSLTSPRVYPISADLMRGPSMGEWLLSRRDRLRVARHEVPGSRPGGTVEVIFSQRYLLSKPSSCRFRNPRYLLKGVLAPNPKPRSVQSSRWDGAIFLMNPGNSCLATIILSLWDEIHSARRGFSPQGRR
jgi:hypothetical protein